MWLLDCIHDCFMIFLLKYLKIMLRLIVSLDVHLFIFHLLKRRRQASISKSVTNGFIWNHGLQARGGSWSSASNKWWFHLMPLWNDVDWLLQTRFSDQAWWWLSEPMSLGRHKLFIWENWPQPLHQDALLIFVDTQLDMLLKYYKY